MKASIKGAWENHLGEGRTKRQANFQRMEANLQRKEPSRKVEQIAATGRG